MGVDVKKLGRRQKVGLIGILAVVLVIVGVVIWQTRVEEGDDSLFPLSASVYEKEGIEEITAEEYQNLLASGKSFLVLAHSTACPSGMPLTSIVRDLAHEHKLTVYGLMTDEFWGSALSRTIKFLPSLAIVRGGEVVDFLDAESDEDLPAYEGLEGLEDWLKRYIKL